MKTEISVADADRVILKALINPSWEFAAMKDSCGRILKEDLRADRDLPPFDKSLVDGIAISSWAYRQGVRRFFIEVVQPAGKPAGRLTNTSNCAEIMTGAVLCLGADCVIPVEKVQIDGRYCQLPDGLQLRPYDHVRRKGFDHRKGDIIVRKGSVIRPCELSVAASVGKTRLKVNRLLKAAVVSTGNEIVDIRSQIKPFQTRKGNAYFLKSALEESRLASVRMFHLPDDRRVLLNKLKTIIREFDIVILSGGVSMGKFDFIPQVLRELGVRVLFHKVRQKPGKPFWFGVWKNRTPIFALPGNPVSTMTCFQRYCLPYIRRVSQAPIQKQFVRLTRNIISNPKLTLFVPVRVEMSNTAVLNALPVSAKGSGDFGSIPKSDGFVEIPRGEGKILKGLIMPFYRWQGAL